MPNYKKPDINEKKYSYAGERISKYHQWGADFKVDDALEIKQAADEYFQECYDTIVKETFDALGNTISIRKKSPTQAGLARAFGITRQTLHNYSKDNSRLSKGVRAVVMDALLYLAECREDMLDQEGKAGQIFLAKNYGYVDKQEVDQNIAQKIDVVDFSSYSKEKKIRG